MTDSTDDVEGLEDLVRIRCDACGQWVGYDAICEGKAQRKFTPDNAFSPESWETLCEKCVAKERP